MTLDRLLHPDGPHLHMVVADDSRLSDAARALESSPSGRTAARIVRGAKTRTRADLFDEFAAALQFPHDFGANWAAFDRCLSGPDWLRADTFVLVISHAIRLLGGAHPEEFALFVELISQATRDWAAPVAPDGRTAQTPRDLHVVFHASPDDEAALSSRLLTAGAVFDVAMIP
jgi:hypothetical protein